MLMKICELKTQMATRNKDTTVFIILLYRLLSVKMKTLNMMSRWICRMKSRCKSEKGEHTRGFYLVLYLTNS